MILIPFIPLYSFQHGYKEHNDYYNLKKKLLKNKKINNSPLGFCNPQCEPGCALEKQGSKVGSAWSGELKCNSSSARTKSPFTLPGLSFSIWNRGIETTSDCTCFEKSKWDRPSGTVLLIEEFSARFLCHGVHSNRTFPSTKSPLTKT